MLVCANMLSYTPDQRRVVLGIPVMLVVLTVSLALHPRFASRLDTCFIHRELERPGPTLLPIEDAALHNYSVLAVWTAMLVLLFLPHDRFLGVFQLSYSTLWFHATYILLAALKAPLEDYSCAGRHSYYPNGISGHYCYFVFVSMTVPFLWRARLQANPQASKVITTPAFACLCLYAAGAIATLYRTWMHGYHSPRQIMLGVALGMCSHALLERIFLGRPPPQDSVAVLLTILGVVAISSYSLYELVWPKLTAGHALTPSHLVFHLALWLILAGSAVKHLESKESVSSTSKPILAIQ
jgi:hypothetical protein